MKKKPIIGIVGAGKWGKNLIREFDKISTISTCVITKNSKNKKWLEENYPHIKITAQHKDIISDQNVKTIVIATPIKTHFKLAKEALLAGKHVFVEKPLTTKSHEAQELIDIAEEKKRIIFVGYVFLHHPIFKRMQDILKKERLQYMECNWKNLAKSFHEDIYLNLLSHEIAIVLKLFGNIKNVQIGHTQKAVSKKDIIHIKASVNGNKTNCTFHIDRISNKKEKWITFITNKNIYIWDDYSLHKLNKKQNSFTEIYTAKKTSLEIECAEFIKSIETNVRPLTDGNLGLSVQKIIEKLQ
ncbi:Gfo/Idh/MocA family protein [Patescibacteria group bacterium]